MVWGCLGHLIPASLPYAPEAGLHPHPPERLERLGLPHGCSVQHMGGHQQRHLAAVPLHADGVPVGSQRVPGQQNDIQAHFVKLHGASLLAVLLAKLALQNSAALATCAGLWGRSTTRKSRKFRYSHARPICVVETQPCKTWRACAFACRNANETYPGIENMKGCKWPLFHKQASNGGSSVPML